MSVSVVPDSHVPPSSSSDGASWRSSVSFNIRVSEQEQQVSFTGMLRPFVAEHMKAIRSTLETAARNATGELQLDFKRLKYMNSVAFLEINRFIRWVVGVRPGLKIVLIISSVIPWAIRKFQVIAEIYPNVSVVVYDKSLYPIQQVIEDEDFINVLRTQEKIVWEVERKIISRHGLRPGMRVADIACGLGDFVLRVQKEFNPEYIIGVDHSRAFLRHAQSHAKSLGIENIEYQYGDAAALLLPDDSFDFVTCRLALQVFHMPEQMVQELYRICRPGGRVYITNEMMSCVTGYPDQALIRHGYDRFLELSRMVGMDFDIGVRTMKILKNAGLEEIKGDLIGIDNMNSDRAYFAKVVESWIVSSGDVARSAEADPKVHEHIAAGLRAHVEAILGDGGYASWPIYAGSGRKPVRP
ncbi:methyltransferase type 11 [Chondromyces apiculatus DSM 436]|uniref:Methyltransferase type 11 n=1 Tax=Chondromyces apiculatus DSM 436 TaxID=1192034 RepID=A0A017SX72_9BACT|nr:methyltransferase type 11 [Chondromyces apiculatus DSM 436]